MHVVLRESRIQIQDQSFFDLSVTDPDPDLDPVRLRRRRTFRLVGRVPGSAASTWIFPHGSTVTRPSLLLLSFVKKKREKRIEKDPSRPTRRANNQRLSPILRFPTLIRSNNFYFFQTTFLIFRSNPCRLEDWEKEKEERLEL